MNKTPAEIRRYMVDNIQDHIDSRTGEVNDTGLAEDSMWNFVVVDTEHDESIIFDLAHEVAAAYEKRTGVQL